MLLKFRKSRFQKQISLEAMKLTSIYIDSYTNNLFSSQKIAWFKCLNCVGIEVYLFSFGLDTFKC